jgi:hypothetical protein
MIFIYYKFRGIVTKYKFNLRCYTISKNGQDARSTRRLSLFEKGLQFYLVLSKSRDSNQIGIAIQATAKSKAITAN